MVNRILIRNKVVQQLYSYLLTRTEFKIETEPDLSSADKRFAHTAYVDLLLLLLELSGHDTTPGNRTSKYAINPVLSASSLAGALSKDLNIRDFIYKGNNNLSALSPVIQELHDHIVESSIFNEYKRKRKIDLTVEANLWTVLFETVIARDAKLIEKLRTIPGYTAKGFDMAIAKVVATIKSYVDVRSDYRNALNNLDKALDKAYELYLSMFALIIELTDEQERRLEAAKNKFLATSSDKNPNMRFVNNAFVAALRNSEQLAELLKDRDTDWCKDLTLVNSLLDLVTASNAYEAYMSAPTSDWETDCEFWRKVMRNIILTSDDLEQALEDKSVFWNDDLYTMGTFVLKTIKRAETNSDAQIEFLPKFKDDEDAQFGAELFEKAVANRETYRGYIDRFVNAASWDPERTAFMDIVIMITAIAEIIGYPNIPLPVTFNEYIDIANSYSSPKSGQFINGILYNVVNYLNEQGIINKQ